MKVMWPSQGANLQPPGWRSDALLTDPAGPSYCNVPKFLGRQIWANSAHPDQTAPRGLHCLQFPLHFLDALL